MVPQVGAARCRYISTRIGGRNWQNTLMVAMCRRKPQLSNTCETEPSLNMTPKTGKNGRDSVHHVHVIVFVVKIPSVVGSPCAFSVSCVALNVSVGGHVGNIMRELIESTGCYPQRTELRLLWTMTWTKRRHTLAGSLARVRRVSATISRRGSISHPLIEQKATGLTASKPRLQDESFNRH